MNRFLFCVGVLVVAGGPSVAAPALDARAASIAPLLPAEPRGPGVPCQFRDVWGPLAASAPGRKLIDEAVRQLSQPMPPFDPEAYQDFVRNGNRTRYQDQNARRWRHFRSLVLGECLEGQGRFLLAIGDSVRSLCADPSWLLPAHDRGAEVFKGGKPYIDLGVAMTGYDMALAAWLLDERLPAETVALMRESVMRRLVEPVRKQMAGEDAKFYQSRNWWASANHNWNAVCTAGSVGALLLLVPDRQERANAIVWAEKNMNLFLGGFAKDGYCSEGIGYWGYGFGHFALLAENVLQQTGGKVDWVASERVRQIAAAALGLEIVNNQYPVFADAGLGSKPGGLLGAHLARRGCWTGSAELNPAEVLGQSSLLYESLAYAFPFQSKAGRAPALKETPARTWLPDGGVFIGRPARPDGLAVALKGGSNAEHHNHNDVGTTMVLAKGQLLLCDPGAMVYTKETFSGERYRFPVMSSYGHAVPVVDGMLQTEGAKSQARVLETAFAAGSDRLRMDLTSCYPVEGLEKVERIWTFGREGMGRLVIEDRFEAGRPVRFGTALIALGQWVEMGVDRLATTGKDGAAVSVRIESSASARHRIVKVSNPSKPSVARLGVDLDEAQANGWIRLTIEPTEPGPLAAARPSPIDAEAPDKLPDLRKAL